MKKTLLLTGALLVLGSSVFAQGKPAKKTVKAVAATPATIKCAVMPSDQVSIKDATANKMFADYKGRRYYFCCGGCPAQFKADPAKFAKNASLPIPKTATPAKKS